MSNRFLYSPIKWNEKIAKYTTGVVAKIRNILYICPILICRISYSKTKY